MTMVEKLLELAERCEKATGPDRWLDGKIAEAIGWQLLFRFDAADDEIIHDRWISPCGDIERATPPCFTASLDAAMTSVPDGADIEVGSCGENQCPWAAITFPFTRDGARFEANGSALAPTLTSAALRARAS